jgi:hypothetical protein
MPASSRARRRSRIAIGFAALALGAGVVPCRLLAQGQAGPAAPHAAQYYYDSAGQPAGPLSAQELRRKIADGTITARTFIWKVGSPAWVALEEDPDFKGVPSVVTAPCAGRHVLMADDFDVIPKGWEDPNWKIKDGKLRVTPQPATLEWQTYDRKLTGDFDLCLTTQIPSRFIYPLDTSAGIVFGGVDSHDFYAFMISPGGKAALIRFKGGKYSPVIDWRDLDAIRTDPGSRNELRVAVKNGDGMFFVNGRLFDVSTDPLPQSGLVGVIVSSEGGQRDSWKIMALKATDLP